MTTNAVRPVVMKKISPRNAKANTAKAAEIFHCRQSRFRGGKIEQHRRAHGEFDALNDITFDRHALIARRPRKNIRPNRNDDGRNQQHNAGDQETDQHRIASLGTAELCHQRRHRQQPDKAVQSAPALVPGHVSPRHSEGAEHKERDRQPTDGAQELTPEIAPGERRNEHDQPQHQQDAGRRGRPRHRCRDRDHQTIGELCQPRPVKEIRD